MGDTGGPQNVKRQDVAMNADSAEIKFPREWAAALSHEVRTPLAGIRGYVEGLADGVLSGEDAHRGVLREVRRLDGLAADLALLAASSADTLPLDPRVFSLGELLVPLMEQYATLAQAQRTAAVLEGNLGATAFADPRYVGVALSAALHNAVCHTPGGRVTITGQRRGTCAVVVIADSGHGCTEVELARAFAPFFRGDESRTRAHGDVAPVLRSSAATPGRTGGAYG
ncbi:cell wall metabolism sensor histidine kinase WalK [Deinococcus sp. YIM 77859]|uniref:sensor histidine kinase n=1 Tax=Deinococcus sp. YIM 77859 TaxID=1540221 RepID=UPI00068E5B93|nr:HAMP domain-containing sensor histidine kinase [Deinococcus sp. YIM 77859]